MAKDKFNKFDELVDRTGTNSVKWDKREEVFGKDDVLPMWVADSDWRTAGPVIEALKERASHGVFGYTDTDSKTDNLVVDWFERRYDWEIEPEWLVYGNGVVPSLRIILDSFTDKGDGVILQPPVYYPFYTSIRASGGQIVTNQLKYEDGRYEMDYDDLEGTCDNGGRSFPANPTPTSLVLCNPHNPVGRVWSEEELEKLGHACLENDLLVISDDIHAEFIYDEKEYTPFASISREFAERSITLTSPSKAFNTAGLPASLAVIPSEGIRRRFRRAGEKLLKGPSVFGLKALNAAYSDGEEWLKDQLAYLESNRDYSLDVLRNEAPHVEPIKPEGTTLLWMDFRGLGLNSEELEELLLEEARVGLDFGTWFGPGGEGFLRLNFACPREILEDGLNRIVDAVEAVA
jgi:cystathionine beta-lyase